MELIKGGKEPATKDDLRNLQLTMLAGFQLCIEETHSLMVILHAMDPSISMKKIDQAIIEQRANFDRQLEMACQQILERGSKE